MYYCYKKEAYLSNQRIIDNATAEYIKAKERYKAQEDALWATQLCADVIGIILSFLGPPTYPRCKLEKTIDYRTWLAAY